MGHRFDLVIFDCDGVLVDSERIANRVLAEMLAPLGLRLTVEEMMQTFVGRSMAVCLTMIASRLGRPVDADFGTRFHARCVEAFTAELRPVAGVEAALECLTIPCCVASSGTPEKICTTLGLTGLLPRFEGRIFSGTQVARGKPAPDLFLHAAAAMDVAPNRCLVVEDTPIGVQAGTAAGMVVLGYAGTVGASAMTAAGAIAFERMTELVPLVTSLDSAAGGRRGRQRGTAG